MQAKKMAARKVEEQKKAAMIEATKMEAKKMAARKVEEQKKAAMIEEKKMEAKKMAARKVEEQKKIEARKVEEQKKAAMIEAKVEAKNKEAKKVVVKKEEQFTKLKDEFEEEQKKASMIEAKVEAKNKEPKKAAMPDTTNKLTNDAKKAKSVNNMNKHVGHFLTAAQEAAFAKLNEDSGIVPETYSSAPMTPPAADEMVEEQRKAKKQKNASSRKPFLTDAQRKEYFDAVKGSEASATLLQTQGRVAPGHILAAAPNKGVRGLWWRLHYQIPEADWN